MYLSQNVETLAEAEHLEGIAPLVKKKNKSSPRTFVVVVSASCKTKIRQNERDRTGRGRPRPVGRLLTTFLVPHPGKVISTNTFQPLRPYCERRKIRFRVITIFGHVLLFIEL